MKDLILNILDTIEQYDTIIIHRHVRPDPDAIGSQGALAELLKNAYPDKNIYVVGSEEKSLAFLNTMDEISHDRYDGALVIVCDTANSPRISDERYKQGDKFIKIDHHPNEDPYGDLIWVDTSASSVCEMIYRFYETGRERGLVLTDHAARLLYAGIAGDTGRFLFDNTTPETFRIASELRKKDFSIVAIYRGLYQIQLKVMRLNGYILQSFEVTDSGAAHIKLPLQLLEEFETTASEASLLVNAFSDLEGIQAWVFFIEEPDQIRVRLRSKGPVVNEIAKKYGGGGHAMAAGATVYSWKETEQVLKELEEACERFSAG
ncbi:MAG TPA: bifunctional oligoribonuclease/PAP phosphatase NrnA [Bacillales bacterium]|nr:bifunctional oligoribonuclease/PAP phosphatase NrnA [Bacillales bacterium]